MEETQIRWQLTDKQSSAWDCLLNPGINEVLFGGGAGGGKTDFGCGFAIYMALKCEGSRGFLAREELKSLKDSTLLTFFDRCVKWGLKEGRDYKYFTDSHIAFKNGSTIFLRELKFLPSDPQFDRLGSTEYTYGFIDEAQQTVSKAKSVLRSRIRYKLKEFGLTPKLLLSCNPHKGYLYSEFYKPAKEGKLAKNRAFVQALAGDNPHIDPSYIENLRTLDPNTRERLLFGNWEYDEDPTKLVEYDAIVDLFTNVLPPSSERYITADIARLGDDRTVIAYWEGWTVKRIAAYKKITTDQTEKIIRQWREKYSVPLSRIIVDEDGIGGGVVDHLQGVKGFTANSTPIPTGSVIRERMNKVDHFLVPKTRFSNLKAQCAWKLAELVNEHEFAVSEGAEKYRDKIIEEMMALMRDKDPGTDTKKQLVPKDGVKEVLGRSPDIGDMMIMRAYFELLRDAKEGGGIHEEQTHKAMEERRIGLAKNRKNRVQNSAE